MLPIENICQPFSSNQRGILSCNHCCGPVQTTTIRGKYHIIRHLPPIATIPLTAPLIIIDWRLKIGYIRIWKYGLNEPPKNKKTSAFTEVFH
jgi:hypothetical protein